MFFRGKPSKKPDYGYKTVGFNTFALVHFRNRERIRLDLLTETGCKKQITDHIKIAGMVQSGFFQAGNETPWQDAGPGAQRQVYGFGENLMLVKVQFEKGAAGALHTHPHAQASYVAGGSFEVTIGDQKKVLVAGDGFYVPPHVLHGCTCLEAGMLVDAFSPCREDFL